MSYRSASDRLRVPEEIAVRVDSEAMRAVVEGMFRSLGAPEADAARSADVLIYADVRGIDSHGVSNMMPVYVEGMKAGWINPTPVWKVLRDAPATASVDSDGGLGTARGWARNARLSLLHATVDLPRLGGSASSVEWQP